MTPPPLPAARRWPPLATGVACALLVAALGGALTDIGPWYQALAKPAFQPPDWALAEVGLLWLSIVALIVVCGRHAPRVRLLLLPYLAWVSFASLVNAEVVRLNAPFVVGGA